MVLTETETSQSLAGVAEILCLASWTCRLFSGTCRSLDVVSNASAIGENVGNNVGSMVNWIFLFFWVGGGGIGVPERYCLCGLQFMRLWPLLKRKERNSRGEDFCQPCGKVENSLATRVYMILVFVPLADTKFLLVLV